MLRRFAPFMVLALIVLASIVVFAIRAMTADRGRCAELYGMLIHPEYPAKNRCDFMFDLPTANKHTAGASKTPVTGAGSLPRRIIRIGSRPATSKRCKRA